MASLLETSQLYQFGTAASDRLAGVVRGSYLYRWLTAEPEPDIIVIDLRETWTVGPVIMLLDWVIEYVERAAGGSTVVAGFERHYEQTLEAPFQMVGRGLLIVAVLVGVAAGVSQSMAGLVGAVLSGLAGLVIYQDNRSWAKLKETRVVELLIATLEQPVPPKEQQLQDDESKGEGDLVHPEKEGREWVTLDKSNIANDTHDADEELGTDDDYR